MYHLSHSGFWYDLAELIAIRDARLSVARTLKYDLEDAEEISDAGLLALRVARRQAVESAQMWHSRVRDLRRVARGSQDSLFS